MDFLYALPHWAMGLLVVSATTGGSLGVYRADHHRRRKLSREEVATGPVFAGIIATVTSLLLAFTAVSVWDSFKSADDAAENEATTATMLARDLAIFGSRATMAARERLREYLTSVEEKEWPLLADGGVSDDSKRASSMTSSGPWPASTRRRSTRRSSRRRSGAGSTSWPSIAASA